MKRFHFHSRRCRWAPPRPLNHWGAFGERFENPKVQNKRTEDGGEEKGRKRGQEVGGIKEKQENAVFTGNFPKGICSLPVPQTLPGPTRPERAKETGPVLPVPTVAGFAGEQRPLFRAPRKASSPFFIALL